MILNWIAGFAAVDVGFGVGVEVETGVGVVPGVGVGELLLPPPHAAITNKSRHENKARGAEYLDT